MFGLVFWIRAWQQRTERLGYNRCSRVFFARESHFERGFEFVEFVIFHCILVSSSFHSDAVGRLLAKFGTHKFDFALEALPNVLSAQEGVVEVECDCVCVGC